MAKFWHAALLCCAVLAVSLQPTQAETGSAAQEMLSMTAENIKKVSEAFTKLLSNPYDLSKQVLPNDISINRAGLNPETVKAAEGLRSKLRQSLSDVVAIAADRTSEFVKSAQAEIEKSGGTSDLLQRLSSIPLQFDAEGKAMVSNPLTAIGTFLVNTLQQRLKAAREQGGEQLDSQLGQTDAGRKLLQEMDAFESSLETDLVDLTQAAPAQGPLAVARQMDKLMDFLTSLTDAADELLEQYDAAKGDEEADAEEESDPIAAASRKLQQLPDPNEGYAKAVRLIFTNIFDFFRANGLYGLTPLLADVRGILTRYGWINDLLNIIDAPLENFINANYVPLPQNNDDFVKLVQNFAARYCAFEKAVSSETVLGAFKGPTVSYEVKPVSCPIYTDKDSGRNYVSFEDCDPATLTVKVTPLTITEAYFTGATYTGTECKYVEPYGTDLTVTLGAGKQAFTFARTARGVNILPTVIQLQSNARINAFEQPTATADSDLPGDATTGNGFFANNFGFAYNGIPNVVPAASG